MGSWSALLLSMMLAGPAAMPTTPMAEPAFNDELFGAPSKPVRPEDVFARSDAMKRYLDTDIAAELQAVGPQRGLVDALYRRDQLQLGYDSTTTRNASQAFATRSGNCLSLAIMTAALARELGLSVRFHKVYVDEAWNRSGGLDVLDEHVNVTLGAADTRSHGTDHRGDVHEQPGRRIAHPEPGR